MGWNVFDRFLSKYRFSMVMEQIPKDSALLDFGCGEGELLHAMEKRIREGVGVDKKIHGISRGKITLLNSDLEKRLPLEDGRFDLVVSLAVIEHLNSAENAVSEMYRMLRRGGSLLMTPPTPQSKPLLEFLAFKLGIISKEEILDHKHYWSREELLRLLKEAGFREISHKYFQFGFNQFIYATK